MHIDDLEQAPRPKAGKPPITANTAFPWIVALWFAALLGVGSLIVPVTLLESASTASGLASVLPMAAPPLGFTAQGLVAFAGTLVGGGLGFFLARKIAAPKVARVTGASSRRPLQPAHDLDDEGIGDDDHDDLPVLSPAPTGRRRSLAIEEEEGPSDFLNIVPLPSARDDSGEKLVVKEDTVEEATFTDAVDDIANSTQFEEPRQEFQPAPIDAEDAGDDEPFELDESAALVEAEPGTEKVAVTASAPRQEFIAPATVERPVFEVGYSEPVEASATAKEPLPFSPPSMASQDAGDGWDEDEASNEGEVEETPELDDAQIFIPEHASGQESEDTVSDKQFFDSPDTPEADIPDAETEEDVIFETTETEEVDAKESEDESEGEGLVQLVQRLGSTLEKHREWAAEMAAKTIVVAPAEAEAAKEQAAGQVSEDAAEEEPVAEAPVPDEFDPAAAEDVSLAMAAYFGSPAASSEEEAAEEVAAEEDTEVAAEVVAEEVTAEIETSEAPVFTKPVEAEQPRQRYEAFRGTIASVDMDDEDEDEEDDDLSDLAASLSLPLSRKEEPAPMPRPAFDQPPPSPEVAEDEGEVDAEEIDEQEPAEVADLATANPFKRNAEEFVRIDEPDPEEGDAHPAVLFPNQEARRPAASANPARAFDPSAGQGQAVPQRAERPRPSNDDNERALREALMNLQRMGK